MNKEQRTILSHRNLVNSKLSDAGDTIEALIDRMNELMHQHPKGSRPDEDVVGILEVVGNLIDGLIRNNQEGEPETPEEIINPYISDLWDIYKTEEDGEE